MPVTSARRSTSSRAARLLAGACANARRTAFVEGFDIQPALRRQPIARSRIVGSRPEGSELSLFQRMRDADVAFRQQRHHGRDSPAPHPRGRRPGGRA
jgi:hypothetical protein